MLSKCLTFPGSDASRDRWVTRHFVRAVQISLVSLPLLLLIPGPAWVRLSALLLGALMGLQYALWFMDGSVERRVRKAGYPAGAAQPAGGAVHAEEHAAAAARYAARYRTSEPPPKPATSQPDS